MRMTFYSSFCLPLKNFLKNQKKKNVFTFKYSLKKLVQSTTIQQNYSERIE